jgi:hypothetical protein
MLEKIRFARHCVHHDHKNTLITCFEESGLQDSPFGDEYSGSCANNGDQLDDVNVERITLTQSRRKGDFPERRPQTNSASG